MSDVSVELGMNAQELYQELQNVTAKFVQFSGQTQQSGEKAGQGFASGLKGGLGSLGTNLTQALGAIGVGREVKEVIEYGAKIQDLSDRFGIGAVELQKFGNAAEKNGSSLEAVAKGYRFLEVAQAKALGGNQGMVKAFGELGISVEDLQTKRPDELMLRLGDSSLNAADVVKVLGRSALELRPVLAGLADGTIQFGDAISAIDIKGLKEADDAFKTLHQTITIALGSAVAYGLESIKTNIEDFVGHLLAGLERIKGYGSSVADFFKGDLKQSAKDVTVANENAENYIKQAGIGTQQRREDEATQKKRDLGAPPEETETGGFDDQGRPIAGGKRAGRDASTIERLKDQNAKEEEQQRLAALGTEERLADLRAKAKDLLVEIGASGPQAGQAPFAGQEELGLQLRHDYLDVTKQIAAEEKKLQSEKDKAASEKDRADKEHARETERIDKERKREAQRDARSDVHKELRESEGAQLTLQDLAEHGTLIGGPGGQARQALEEQRLARTLALNGDLEGSRIHQSRANEIKDSIGVLKDSEKSAAYQEALEKSAVLNKIEKNTQGLGVNK